MKWKKAKTILNEYSTAELLDKGSSKLINRYFTKIPKILQKKKGLSGPKLTHISAFTFANAGDALLPVAVRDSIEGHGIKGYRWLGIKTSREINTKLLSKINSTQGIVIGGGGLFLKDTNENIKSGWQWSCPIDMLNKIQVPIVLFAVGYNRFRGQDDFEPIFREHVNLVAQKSPFIGLRNHGSIENMKKYIDYRYHDVIKYQPCPTTILSKLYPKEISVPSNHKPKIALNCAFDRSKLRFGNRIGDKLSSIANVIKELSKQADIYYFSHMWTDDHFLPFLDGHEVRYEVVHLNSHPRKMLKAYSSVDLVIGMRGHAQMIPYGCGTPILSIISHEKMRWFLEDIKKPEWGVEINSDVFEEQLLKKALTILDQNDRYREELKASKQPLIDITQENVQYIKHMLKIR